MSPLTLHSYEVCKSVIIAPVESVRVVHLKILSLIHQASQQKTCLDHLHVLFCLCWLDKPSLGSITMPSGINSPHPQFHPPSARSFSVSSLPHIGHSSGAGFISFFCSIQNFITDAEAACYSEGRMSTEVLVCRNLYRAEL